MNFFAHAFAQCAIDDLMALHTRFSGKGFGNDHRLEMGAVALDGQVGAIELFANITFNGLGGDHGIGNYIRKKLDCAHLAIDGDGAHFQAVIVSEAFA